MADLTEGLLDLFFGYGLVSSLLRKLELGRYETETRM